MGCTSRLTHDLKKCLETTADIERLEAIAPAVLDLAIRLAEQYGLHDVHKEQPCSQVDD